MRRRAWTAIAEPWIGVVVAAGALALFALAMRAPPRPDLWARTRSKDTFLFLEDSPRRQVTVGPEELAWRVERFEPEGESSTSLLGYRVVYGQRWEREITVPSVGGPLQPEGSPWPCAVKVRMRPTFLDDGRDHAGDVISIIDRQMRDQFPRVIEVAGFKVFELAKVRASHYEVRLDRGKIALTGEITLDDGASPTVFEFDAVLALGEDKGDLRVTLERFDLDWSGNTRRALLVGLVDLVADVEKLAEGEVKREIGKVLPFLRMPKEAFDLAKLAITGPRAGADAAVAGALTVRLCAPPIVDASGISFELGAKIELTGPRRSKAINGPPVTRAAVAPLAFPQGSPALEGENLEAVANGEALQQTLYLLWQSRVLDAWGKSRSVIDAFRAQLEDRLALDVTGLDVGLPPAVVSGLGACDGFGIRLADAAFGQTEEGAQAIAHADLCAIPSVSGDRIDLLGTLRHVSANCVGKDGTLRPCLSDVVPVLRAEDLSKYEIPLSMPIPERLIRVSLVKGAALTLSGMRAETRGGLLTIRAKARLVPE